MLKEILDNIQKISNSWYPTKIEEKWQRLDQIRRTKERNYTTVACTLQQSVDGELLKKHTPHFKGLSRLNFEVISPRLKKNAFAKNSSDLMHKVVRRVWRNASRLLNLVFINTMMMKTENSEDIAMTISASNNGSISFRKERIQLQQLLLHSSRCFYTYVTIEAYKKENNRVKKKNQELHVGLLYKAHTSHLHHQPLSKHSRNTRAKATLIKIYT